MGFVFSEDPSLPYRYGQNLSLNFCYTLMLSNRSVLIWHHQKYFIEHKNETRVYTCILYLIVIGVGQSGDKDPPSQSKQTIDQSMFQYAEFRRTSHVGIRWLTRTVGVGWLHFQVFLHTCRPDFGYQHVYNYRRKLHVDQGY